MNNNTADRAFLFINCSVTFGYLFVLCQIIIGDFYTSIQALACLLIAYVYKDMFALQPLICILQIVRKPRKTASDKQQENGAE